MRILSNQAISYNHFNKSMLINDGILTKYERSYNGLLKFLLD